MPLWLRLVNLWCRDRCPWGASACGRLPRTSFLEPLRARQSGRRQRPALSCSHQRKPGVTPAGNNLHTSPLPCGVWCGRGLAARPFEGMGQLCFPLVRPRTPWGARRSRFRRDVPQRHRSVARLRRCEPPPPQNVFSEGDRFFRGGLPNCAFGRTCCHGLPQVRGGSRLPPAPGGPACQAPQATPVRPRSTCAGSAAVRTASPAQSRATPSSLPLVRGRR